MKHFVLIGIFLILLPAAMKAQNIECPGNTVHITMQDYKAGNIQWQFSTNALNWIDLTGKNASDLTYSITSSGFFRAKISYGNCIYFSDTTQIDTYPPSTIASAGPDQIKTNSDTVATLAANMPVIGSGKWTIVSGGVGFFANDTVPSTVFTGHKCSDYILIWTITGTCTSSSDSISVGFHDGLTTANAGPDQSKTTTDTVVTLAANSPVIGKGRWSVASGVNGNFANDTVPATSFTGRQCSDYVLRWTISNDCTTSSDNINIGFHAEPTAADAGPDQNLTNSDTVVTLVANAPTIGTGKWSVVSGEGGNFANASNPTTTFTGNSCSDYVLAWTISTLCKSTSTQVSISFHNMPTAANAGPDQSKTNSDTVVTLAANTPINGKGLWSVVSGSGGSFTDATNPTTTFSGKHHASYVLRWTISTACNSSSDDVKIGFQILVTHVIQVSDFQFTPSALTNVNIGDTIKWIWVSGSHTVTSETIPGGAATFNFSMNSSSPSAKYIVKVAGTYNYQCDFHAGEGMIGSFVVNGTKSVSSQFMNPMKSGTTGTIGYANEKLNSFY
jgi:plastocyanin